MKVLHIIEPSGMGGVEKIVAEIYNNLSNINSNCHIYIAIPKSFKEDFVSNFKIKNNINIVDLWDNSKKKYDLTKLLNYRKMINSIQPDIIHTHSRKACVLTCLVNKKIKHIRTQHMEDSYNVNKIEKVFLKKRVNLWITTSNLLKETYTQKVYGNVKVKCIYNGVEESKVNEKNLNSNLKFATIGRLNKQKGIDILINELPKVNKALKNKYNVTIIGTGEEEKELKKLVSDNGLSEICKFIGHKKDIFNELKNIDVLLMPSRKEGLPLVMLEAMSSRVPVVASNVGAISEVIEHGINGIIVNENNHWCKYIENIVEGNVDLLEFSENAYKTFKSKFTSEKMCHEYYKSYNELLE